MPELPEVEVSRLGVSPYLLNETIDNIIVRERRMRWPIPEDVALAIGKKVIAVKRRACLLYTSPSPRD